MVLADVAPHFLPPILTAAPIMNTGESNGGGGRGGGGRGGGRGRGAGGGGKAASKAASNVGEPAPGQSIGWRVKAGGVLRVHTPSRTQNRRAPARTSYLHGGSSYPRI